MHKTHAYTHIYKLRHKMCFKATTDEEIILNAAIETRFCEWIYVCVCLCKNWGWDIKYKQTAFIHKCACVLL